MFGIKSLDLFDRCSGVLDEVENIDFAMTVHDPHADCRMLQRIKCMCFSSEWVEPLDLGCLFNQSFDQPLPFDRYRICLWTFWNVSEYKIWFGSHGTLTSL